MPLATPPLRDDALAIWYAGLDAVRSDRLVQDAVQVRGEHLIVGDQRLALREIRRLAVVGCGKAGAGMAAGLEAALGEPLMRDKQLTGWINVPDDCVRPLPRIHLHGARPAGVNEPTAAGAAGAERILELVRSLGDDDVCLCLISGGGSALLPAPAEGITLDDKLVVTRHLSAAGANIRELNTVRKQLSRIKGGGLARACGAGRLIALIISDVLGDPLDVIASGPTVADASTPQQALEILDQFQSRQAGVSPRVFQVLERAQGADRPRRLSRPFFRGLFLSRRCRYHVRLEAARHGL
jgi:hydroxypyruvate reductase